MFICVKPLLFYFVLKWQIDLTNLASKTLSGLFDFTFFYFSYSWMEIVVNLSFSRTKYWSRSLTFCHGRELNVRGSAPTHGLHYIGRIKGKEWRISQIFASFKDHTWPTIRCCTEKIYIRCLKLWRKKSIKNIFVGRKWPGHNCFKIGVGGAWEKKTQSL